MADNGQLKENVNLLPEEMRKEEEKELKRAEKTPRVIEIEMSDPKRGFTFNSSANGEAEKGPGFWSTVFKAKAKGIKELAAKPAGFALEKKAGGGEKKPSWWSRLFAVSEEKERRRSERLALAKAKEEARRRQKAALKLAKQSRRHQLGQKGQSALSEKSLAKKEELGHKEKMRWLVLKKRREEKEQRLNVKSANWRKEKWAAAVNPPASPAGQPVLPAVKLPPPVQPVTWPRLPVEKKPPEKKQKIQLTAGQTNPIGRLTGLDVNLIPRELLRDKELKLSSRIAGLAGAATTAILAVGLLYFLIVFYQLRTIDEIKAVEAQSLGLKAEIADYEPAAAKAAQYQQQLKSLESLFANHFYWTKFFGLLEKYTAPDVYYTSFAADTARGNVSLSAVAKNYEALAKQLVAFRQAVDFVAKVDINSASAAASKQGTVESVSFNLNLQLKPEVFLRDFSKND